MIVVGFVPHVPQISHDHGPSWPKPSAGHDSGGRSWLSVWSRVMTVLGSRQLSARVTASAVGAGVHGTGFAAGRSVAWNACAHAAQGSRQRDNVFVVPGECAETGRTCPDEPVGYLASDPHGFRCDPFDEVERDIDPVAGQFLRLLCAEAHRDRYRLAVRDGGRDGELKGPAGPDLSCELSPGIRGTQQRPNFGASLVRTISRTRSAARSALSIRRAPRSRRATRRHATRRLHRCMAATG